MRQPRKEPTSHAPAACHRLSEMTNETQKFNEPQQQSQNEISPYTQWEEVWSRVSAHLLLFFGRVVGWLGDKLELVAGREGSN